MRNPYTPPAQDDVAQQFLMRIADLLSDDPLLIAVLGENFKVAADYDSKKKFVRYIFTPTTDDDRRLAKKA